MKKIDFVKQLSTLDRIKLHEKEAEINFSSFDDGYVGDDENFEDNFEENFEDNFDDNYEDNFEEDFGEDDNFIRRRRPKKKKKAGVGMIRLNTLKVRLVSDGSVPATGLNVPLFGGFTNLYATNLNIPNGITVVGTPTGYREILATSISKPWIVRGLKIIVGGTAPAAQLNQNFSVVTTDLTGRSTTDPYFPSDHFSAFQQQNGIIEMKEFETRIDGNTQMNYVMLPQQTVDLLLYVKAQVDPTRVAQGKSSLGIAQRNYPNPQQQTLVIRQQQKK